MRKKRAPSGSKAGTKNNASIRDKAYQYIQRKIASGQLPAGRSISELSLAKELGSSRTPIREAVSQLAAEGLLEQTPNRGAVVRQLSRRDIVELFELREALELYAVAKAAHQPPRPADLERLYKLADEAAALTAELHQSGQNNLSPEQMRRYLVSDLGFHTLLMRMAANTRISKVVNESRLLIRVFGMPLQGHNASKLAQLRNHHRALVTAVEAQDPHLATQLMAEHIQVSLRERLEEFDHWEQEKSFQESVPMFFGTPPASEQAS